MVLCLDCKWFKPMSRTLGTIYIGNCRIPMPPICKPDYNEAYPLGVTKEYGCVLGEKNTQ